MIGIAAEAAEQHVTCREIITIKLERAVSGHEWVVFVTETERRGELRGDAIAIPDEPTELPFPSRRFDKLFALAYSHLISGAHATLASQTEFELRQSVERIGSSSPGVECRGAAAEVEFAARASPQLGLPVIQVMVDDVGPDAGLVLAMRPPEVVRTGEAPIVAESGVPSLGIANIGKTRNGEEGHTTTAQVRRIIGTRNPQHVETDVLAEVWGLAELAHASKAYVTVKDQVGREGQGVADCDQLHKRMKVTESAVTGTIANGIAQARHTVKHRLHGAVLGKKAVLGGAVPVNLRVEIVTIQTLRS